MFRITSSYDAFFRATESNVLSFYGKIRQRENKSFGIFCAVIMKIIKFKGKH